MKMTTESSGYSRCLGLEGASIPHSRVMTRSFRGTVIRTPDVSPGLLYVGGQQKSFLLAGVWTFRKMPEPNMIIEAELDDSAPW